MTSHPAFRRCLAIGLLPLLLLASACSTVMPPDPGAQAPAPVVATPVPLPEAAPPPAPRASEAMPSVTEAQSPPGAVAMPVPLPNDPVTGEIVAADPAQAHTDLWQRVRSGFGMPELDGDYVRKWEQWYARDPAYVKRMTDRGGRYLFHIVEELERRGMPTELALLPFIESAFNPQAQSRARASGMWQFMPATGKDFELRQNLFRDDRRDVLASTRAALDYLQRLHGMFGDWHLALAAYNWGQGNVARALDRNRRAGQPLNYEALRMPNETREYVPKLQAVKNIVLRPEAFSLELQPLENHPFFLSVPIDRDMDVALAARLAGLTAEEFQQLNPQMNKPVILAAGTPQVLLPYDNANRFRTELAAHRGALASWTAWVAPKTLKPAEAARLTGMPEAQLREVNRIPPRMLVKAGSTLLVPRGHSTTADVAEHIADNALLNLAPEGRKLRSITFRAGKGGDSVAAVARRYRVSAAQVAAWNGVSTQSRFKAGQSIVVQVAAPARSAKGSKPARVAKTGAAPSRRSAGHAPATGRRPAPRVAQR